MKNKKFDLEIKSKKELKKYHGITYGKLLFELNKYYLKYDHRTLDSKMVNYYIENTKDDAQIMWMGGGSKLTTVITKSVN